MTKKTNGKRQWVRASDRLKRLPPVIHLSELGLNRYYARDATHRWCEAGYLAYYGHRSGVYYNLVADEQAPERYVREAGLKAMLIGGRFPRNPWITGDAALMMRSVMGSDARRADVPLRTFVAVDVDVLQGARGCSGLALHQRPTAWYRWASRQMEEHGLAGGILRHAVSGAPALPAEIVLADHAVYRDYDLGDAAKDLSKAERFRAQEAAKALEAVVGVVQDEPVWDAAGMTM